jgi:hypothetical protein
VKAANQAIAAQANTYRAGLWMLIALLVWITSAGCATAAEPQGSDPIQGNSSLNQEPPTSGTTEIIQVDLDAIEVAPDIRSAAEACVKLEGPLRQVVEAKDPAQAAQALGMPVRENLVQVSLVLDGSDTAFLERAGIDVAKQIGQEIQAFVPLLRLCDLAADERVLVIRPVSLAETQ